MSFVALGAYCAYPFLDVKNIDNFVALITSASGTLAGFLFTCMTILVGMNNELIKKLKRYGHLKKLLTEMFFLIIVLLLLVLLGGVDALLPHHYKIIMDKVLFVLFFVSAVQFWITFRRFYLIIKVSADISK